MFARDRYLNMLIDAMWDGEIKVIIGLRRSGKSTLLFGLFRDYLKQQGVMDNQILCYELDQRKYYKYRNQNTLCGEVEEIVSSNKERLY